MAQGEIIFDYGLANTGKTLYAIILFPQSGHIFVPSTRQPVEYVTADRATYKIAMTEMGNQGIYLASMPAITDGELSLIICEQAGGSPADSDVRVFFNSVIWKDGKLVSGDSYVVRSSQ